MKIYNTLSRKKEDFVPVDENEVKIYVCGPTVYNYFHIGNARPFVVFDTLRRYLEYRGKKVKYVQNFTDVDDKIINKAREEGVTPGEISEKYIAEYYKDAAALNVEKATIHPKVTENMDEIIQFIKRLIEKGHAYEVDGDVYFSTRSFNNYGKLSRQNIEDLESGARIEVGEKKEDPLDFALWKARKSEDEIAWESPWGMGRPGWHIECSVMSTKYLGDTIDIHAGGQDLTFPHHENEIAQTEAATGKPFAKYWMHNGYITIDNEKMSKSKGNFFTVRDILKHYDGEVIRFFLLSGHYRNPINFSDEMMEQAKNSLMRMRNAKDTLKHLIENEAGDMSDNEREQLQELQIYKDKFIEAMDDDLNTADAISAVFELIRQINLFVKNGCSKEFAEQCLALLNELTGVLGLLQDAGEEELDAEIEALVRERQKARTNKDFKRADEIRDLLKAKGITLKDTPQGVQIIKE
ncbi:MAG: cysteine--tRNA ligase [Anaerovoracaceae bacterium]|jgi:cysteinyl-tRNA synthetase|nr:cysteine--tRNA ligase [Bacillota bacterium]HQC82278.1 cysteine--tRNA ligase [Bacillota bacterium]